MSVTTNPIARTRPTLPSAGWLEVVGTGLGLLAGATQIIAGAAFPTWTGNKSDHVGLGLTTVVLTLLAAGGLRWLRREDSMAMRAVLLVGVLLCVGICFTTVGRLWYLPRPLLIAAAVLAFAAGPVESPGVSEVAPAPDGRRGPEQTGPITIGSWATFAAGLILGVTLVAASLVTVLLSRYASSVAAAAALSLVTGCALAWGVAPDVRRRALAMLVGGLGAGLMAGGIALAVSAALIRLG